MSTAVPWALLARSIAGAVLGAGAALIIGLIAIALAPDNGFADLAAAAVTRVVVIPLGAVVGGIVAFRVGRCRSRPIRGPGIAGARHVRLSRSRSAAPTG